MSKKTRRGRGTGAGRETKWTPQKRLKFLEVLAKNANATLAAQAVGLSRSRAYRLRDEDKMFAAAWDAAVEEAGDRLEAEAWRRAVEGWTEPVFGKLAGELAGDGEIGAIQKYSNTLLIFLMKGAKPEKYREHIKAELTGPVTVELVSFKK